VTFDSGVVKDGTQVTLSSSAQPPDPIPEGTQTLSKTVTVEVPAGSLSTALAGDEMITIDLPSATSSASISIFSSLSPGTAFAQTGSAIDYGAIFVKLVGKKVLPYLFPKTAQFSVQLGKFSLVVPLRKLIEVGFTAVDVVKIFAAAVDLRECFVPEMQLYQVSGNGAFSTQISIERNKTPLVLIHGSQELNAKSCKRAYETTWSDDSGRRFANLFFRDDELKSNYQLFSVQYNSLDPINQVNGPKLAKLLNDNFPTTQIIVLTHSIGGMVARAALDDPPLRGSTDVRPARIEGLVTLATPHEGMPIASREGAEVLKALRPALIASLVGLPIISTSPDWILFVTSLLSLSSAGGSEGFKDLAFDSVGFTDWKGSPGNPELAALRQRELQRQLTGRYVAYAGDNPGPLFLESVFRDLNFGFPNDWLVPVGSGRFEKASIQGRTFPGVNHLPKTEIGMPRSDV
jgi:pimeloyl-ACP methyl ester carboxylesterase